MAATTATTDVCQREQPHVPPGLVSVILALVTFLLLCGHEWLQTILLPQWGVFEPEELQLPLNAALIAGVSYLVLRKLETLHQYALAETTERQSAEEKNRFQAHLLDAVGVAIITTDLEGVILYWNRFAETLYGWTAQEVIGRNASLMVPESSREQSVEILENIRRGERWMGEFTVQRRDGTTFPALVTDTPVYDATGALIGITGISSSLSDRKESEAMMRQIIEGAHCLLWTATVQAADGAHHWILSVPDPAAAERFLPLEREPGESYIDAFGRSRVEADMVACHRRAATALDEGWSTYRQEYRILAAQGVVRWMAEEVQIERAGPSAWRLVAVTVDITERKQAEARQQALLQGLNAVVALADELLAAPELDTLLRQAVDMARERLGLERCAIYLWQPEINEMRGTYGTDGQGQTTDERAIRFSTVDHWVTPLLSRDAKQPGAPRWFVDPKTELVGQGASTENGCLDSLGKTGWVVATPIFSASGPVGVLYNDSALTDAPLDTITQEVVVVYCSLLGSIIDRTRAEAALRDSEARFRGTFDQAAVGIAHVSPEGRFLLVNDKLCDILGRSRDELLGLTSADLTVPEDQAAGLAARRAMVAGVLSTYAAEKRYRGKDGDVIWVNLMSTLERTPAGEPEYFISVFEDITARKRLDEALRESEARFSNAFEHAPIGVALVSPGGRFLKVNQALCDLVGYSEDELLNRTFQEITYAEDLPADLEHVRQLLAGESLTFQMEKHYVHARGHLVMVLLSVSLVRDAQGEPVYFISQIQDITERKQAEARLIESRQRLALATESAHIGIWDWDVAANQMVWDAQMYALYGIREQDFSGAVDAWQNGLHPEDRARAEAEIMAALDGSNDFHTQFRVAWPNGEVRHVKAHAVVQRGSDGVALRMTGVNWDITEIQHAEQALRRSHDELETRVERRTAALAQANAELRLQRTILEAQGEASIDGILVVSVTGKLVSFNRRFAEMWGIAPEVIAARTDGVVLPAAVNKVQDRAVFTSRVEYLNQHPDAVSQEEILLTDGRTFDRYSAPVKNAEGVNYGRIWYYRDITERKQAEARLRASEERFRQMTECVTEVFWMTDVAKNSMVYISPAYEAVWGRPCAELYVSPRLWLEAIEPEDRPRILDAMMTKQLSGEYDEHYRITRPDGEVRWIHDRGYPVKNQAGEVYRVVGIAADITKRHLAEAAMRTARDEAEAANAAKSEFLSRMSHELRTPLNAILGFGQILEMRGLGPKESQSVEHILKAGRHLLQLVNEVLDISRMEAGRMSLSPEPVAIIGLVSEALDLIRPMAAQRAIQASHDLAQHPAWHVMADRQRLKQVLLNLLTNAVKYNRDGGHVTVAGEIRSAPGPAAGETLRLSVRDTGGGLSPVELTRLFVPFERLGAPQLGVDGCGIGLTLSKQLMKVMGGTIGVESTVGVGSVFWIELPMAAAPANPARPGAVPVAVPGAAAKPPRTVLYIEDNLPNLTLIEHVLAEDATISLLPAMQGSVGLDLASQHHPDLILLDLHLPDMPGEEVLRRLRAEPATRDIPVVIISADATPRQLDRMMLAGARSYLTKPLDLSQFLRVVHEALNERGK